MDGLNSFSQIGLDLLAACTLIGSVVAYMTCVAWEAIRAENATAAPPEATP